jgi:hypothetical protein
MNKRKKASANKKTQANRNRTGISQSLNASQSEKINQSEIYRHQSQKILSLRINQKIKNKV